MNDIKNTIESRPTIVGIGLVALDVILNGNPTTPAKLCAGGSCGNVLSILSFFGWDSKPIARLANNNATICLVKDLENLKVNSDLISRDNNGSTPIIIHRILRDKRGKPTHRFEFRIPWKKDWLPGFKPVLSNVVGEIVEKQSTATVFYLDRVSRSAISLAKYYKGKGALIVFEPSSYYESKQFAECIELTDIIKFSSDRINNYSELFPLPNVPLEIETLGNGGLNYRLKSDNSSDWNRILPFTVDNFVDGAGAGDWCTAGIIHELGQKGKESFKASTKKDIITACIIGQALGALNCTFDGARGIIYNVNYPSLNELISNIITNNIIPIIRHNSDINITTISNFNFENLLK
jgi:fructokinase